MSAIKTYPVDEGAGSFQHAYPQVIKRVLLARGISSDDQLDQRLGAINAPDSMRGMEAATDILQHALIKQKKVLVCGDYDADGATSTALIIRVLRAMGLKNIDFLVPNRFDFGYGLSKELVDVAVQNHKPELIITVDNGISSIGGVAHAREQGIQVLITDHHLPGCELPNAHAIVNPNQPDCEFPSKNLAGVGVVFYLLIALRAKLRASGWFVEQAIEEPRLEAYLDIVALGTVADVVPLDKLNRILVAQGLRLIRSGLGNAGIRSLFAVAGRDFKLAQSTDLGFAIGPRINAAGRLDDITRGILCLLEDNQHRAHELALDMHQINQDRRQIQDQMIAQAEQALAKMPIDKSALPWGYSCYQQDWHQGLVGLVASRLKEQLHRPVVAFAKSDSESELKGSSRSISGLHIRDCLELVSAQNPGLIKKFGGHAMAAGLTIDSSCFEQFAAAFDQAVRTLLNPQHLEAIIWTDGELDEAHLSLSFATELENLLPWGQGVPEPQFTGEFKVEQLRWLKETHLKLKLTPKNSSRVFDAIWFNAPVDIVEKTGDHFRAVYRLGVNRYMGRESLQLMLVAGEAVSA